MVVPTHEELFEVGLGEALAANPAVSEEVARAPGSTLWWELNAGAAMGAEVGYQLLERFRQSFVETSTGPGLDRVGADRYSTYRQGATAARVELEFTRATSVGLLTIPVGTEVRDANQSVVFATDVELPIPDGETVGTVIASSTALGVNQRAEPDTLVQFVGGPAEAGLVVTNPERSAGGNDRESESDYRARLRGVFVNAGKGTLSALVQGALTVDEVRSAASYEVVDSSGCPRAWTVIVADQNGDSNSSMVADVEEVLEEWRPAGVPGDVIGGVRVVVPISVRVVFESGTSTAAALLDVRRAIVARVNQLKPRSEDTVEAAVAAGRAVLTPGYVDAAVRTIPRVVGVEVLLPAATEVPELGEVIRTDLGSVATS